jgi:hypothetical protein
MWLLALAAFALAMALLMLPPDDTYALNMSSKVRSLRLLYMFLVASGGCSHD